MDAEAQAAQYLYQWILDQEQAERDRLAGEMPRDPDDEDRVGCVGVDD